MHKFLGNVKKLFISPVCDVSPPTDIPAHLNTPDIEEDDFCLIGLSVGERSAVGSQEYSHILPPPYNQVVMGSNQSRETSSPETDVVAQPLGNPPPNLPHAPTSNPSNEPPPDIAANIMAASQPDTPQSVYSDVPFQLAPSFGGVDKAHFDSYPHIAPINWNLYQYDFSLERNVTQCG